MDSITNPVNSPSPVSGCAPCSGVAITAPSLDTHVYAVHATHTFPQNNRLVGGMSGFEELPGEAWQRTCNACRPLVFFSLGELVNGHEGDKWEEAPYVLLTPLKNLLPQTVHLSAGDTFILGDFEIPPDSVLIIREGHQRPRENLTCKMTVATGSMREAAKMEIQKLGGYVFHTATVGNESFEWNGQEIAPSPFFEPLKEVYPHLYVDGDSDFYREQLAQSFLYGPNSVWIFLELFTKKSPPEFSEEVLREWSEGIQRELARMHDYKTHFCGSAPHTVIEAIDKAIVANSRFLNIIRAEAMLRKSYGKSLWGLQGRDEEAFHRLHDWASDFDLLCRNLTSRKILKNLVKP